MKLINILPATMLFAALLITNQSSAQTWNVTGNAGTATTNYLGTSDAKDLKIKTNNTTRMLIKSSGQVGIGTSSPAALLHVQKTSLSEILIKSTGAGSQLTVDRAGNGWDAVTRYTQTGVPQWKTGLTVNGTGSPDYVIKNEINNNDALSISGSSNYVTLPAGVLTLGTSNASSIQNSGNDLKMFATAPANGSGNPAGNVILAYPGNFFKSGNVGIGTNDASLAKLVVQGSVGNTMGMFRRNSSSAGVSIVGDWPGIYFNSYFSGTQKVMSPGYAGIVNFDPVNGNLILGISAGSAAAAGDTITSPEALTIDNKGNVGIGTTTPNYKLHVASSTYYTPIGGYSTYVNGTGVVGVANASFFAYGVAGSSSLGFAGNFTGNLNYTGTLTGPSDIRLKENIKPLTHALDNVMKVETKTYNYKTEEYKSMNLSKGNQFGFVAQQLETVYPDLVKSAVDKNDKGEVSFQYKCVNYIGMIPILTSAIQELKTSLDEKNNEIDQLKNRLTQLENKSSKENAFISKNSETINFANETVLFQNQPNPFSQSTVIAYQLAHDVKNGIIVIRSLNGEELKSITLSNAAKGQVTIHANELVQGTYTYTLIVNGKSLDTKLMVVTK